MPLPINPAGEEPDIHSIRALGSSFYEVDGVNGLMRADVIWAIQDDEAAAFRRLLPPGDPRVRVLSHIVEGGAAVPPTGMPATAPAAAFIGSSFAANIASLDYFVAAILPLVLAREPAFRLHVAGAICRDVADHPAIVKRGRVAHVRDAFVGAPILINPIRAGTGVKIKLLEAMALGIPAVSTAFGVRGIDDAYLGGTLRVADADAAGFADALVRLLRDPALHATLAARARDAAQAWNARQERELDRTLALAALPPTERALTLASADSRAD